MGLRNTEAGWGWPARLLHWGTAAVVLFLLGLGVYMSNAKIDLMAQFELVQTHKSWGFVAFSLGLLRLIWRALQPESPAPPASSPAWERRAAQVSHAALYVLLVAMPVSGWLMASASPVQDMLNMENMVFGAFALPDPFRPGDEILANVFKTIHIACAIALTTLIVVHAAAALRHHFVARDRVLMRMISGR